MDHCAFHIQSACLVFALPTEERERTRFRYQYSVYQLEYSRNLLLRRAVTALSPQPEGSRARDVAAKVRELTGSGQRFRNWLEMVVISPCVSGG